MATFLSTLSCLVEIQRLVIYNTLKYAILYIAQPGMIPFLQSERWALVMWTVHYISPECKSITG